MNTADVPRHFFDEFLDDVQQLRPIAQAGIRHAILESLGEVRMRCEALLEAIDTGEFIPEMLYQVCPIQTSPAAGLAPW